MPDEPTPEQIVQQKDENVRQEIVEEFEALQSQQPESPPGGTTTDAGGTPEVPAEEPRFDPQVEDLAKNYGFTPEIIDKFQDQDELLAAMASLDRKAIDGARQQQQQVSQAWQQHWQQQQRQPAPPPQPAQQPAAPPQLNLDDLAEDDPIRRNFEYLNQTNQTLLTQLQQMGQYMAQQQQLEQVKQYNNYSEEFQQQLDGMENGVYGNRATGPLSQEQRRNREEALQQYWPLLQYEYQRDPYHINTNLLAKRAAMVAHADQIVSSKTQQRTEQIRQRSAQRTGGQSRSRYTPPGAIGDTRVTREMELYPSQDGEFMGKVHEMLNGRE